MHGDGLQSRDFTFIADAVRANLLRRRRAGRAVRRASVYNIARGEPSSLLDLLGILADQLGVTVSPDHVAPRAGDVRHSHADISAARRDLGYGPSVSFADGLSRTLDWFRERAESGERPAGGHPMTDTASRAEAAPSGAPAPTAELADDLAADLLRKLNERTARVLIVGQGYVGLPVAMRAVEVGFDVVGLEASPARAAALQAGSSYVADVPDEQLRGALDAGYRAVGDPADVGPFDVAIITVPTPLRDGAPDLSYVEDAATSLARRLRAGALVVLESTTYPGTTDELVRPAPRAVRPEGGASSSSATRPSASTPATPAGASSTRPRWCRASTSRRCAASRRSTARSSTRSCPSARPAEAELVKLLENTFRHVNIALVNELAMFADATSASTSGAPSTRAAPSRSATCGSRPARAWAATACPSTRRTCRGG